MSVLCKQGGELGIKDNTGLAVEFNREAPCAVILKTRLCKVIIKFLRLSGVGRPAIFPSLGSEEAASHAWSCLSSTTAASLGHVLFTKTETYFPTASYSESNCPAI